MELALHPLALHSLLRRQTFHCNQRRRLSLATFALLCNGLLLVERTLVTTQATAQFTHGGFAVVDEELPAKNLAAHVIRWPRDARDAQRDRAVVIASQLYDRLGLDAFDHPVVNACYYAASEIVPSLLVLFILRKLPPKRTSGQYHALG